MEHLIAFHCSPALAGIKPSNIINCFKKDYPDLSNEVKRLNSELNKKDIYIEILCECEKRALLMVYREKKLKEYLEKKEIAELLIGADYPEKGDLSECISFLKERLSKKCDFPHEIGAFLGYPIHDIYGFLNKNRSKCLYTGYWKVYANVEESKEKFRRFDICRNEVLKRVMMGKKLSAIFGV